LLSYLEVTMRARVWMFDEREGARIKSYPLKIPLRRNP
jgi:hypothetical protein